MYADRKQFSERFSEKNTLQEEEWVRYFLKHGSAISIVKTRKARNLIQNGISTNFRGMHHHCCMLQNLKEGFG